MAARAYWQGQIRLALVSIPVEIYSATKSGAKIRFNQIHEPSGKRISYEKVVPGIGPVDRDEIIKGYEVSKGNYVLLDEDEIDAVRIESKRTLELVQFVDACEIDPLYFEKPYYVAPQDELAEEAFIVLREALRKAKKVALGQLSVRGSEKLVAVKPCGKGLLLETLRYADEVRAGQAFFDDIDDAKPEKELLELANTLIERIRGSLWSGAAQADRQEGEVEEQNRGDRGCRRYRCRWRLQRHRPDGGAQEVGWGGEAQEDLAA